jgi:hypothetical protein
MTELRTRLRRLRIGSNTPLFIAVAVVVVLPLLVVTIIALRLIWVGWDIADGIITAAQPDALASGWLVVATAFIVGVAPLIALAAAVGRVFAGGNPGHPRSTTEDENNTGGQSNPARAPSRPSLLASESAVSATAIAAIVQLFVLLSGTPDVSPETRAAMVAGVTAVAGLYIRQKQPPT